MVFFKKGDILKLERVNENIKKEISQIKEESNEHLDAINENTNEIQGNYNHLSELDNKINKLNDKVDEIEMMLKHIMKKSFTDDKDEVSIQHLTVPEKKIFLVLYTSEGLLSYKDLAFSSSLTETLVSQYIDNLIEKGVPIVKQYRKSRPFIGLSSQFKELQAKNNLVNLG